MTIEITINHRYEVAKENGLGKIIGGKRYYPVHHMLTKYGAESVAEDCRKIGYYARVVYQKSKPAAWRWAVYVRRKK